MSLSVRHQSIKVVRGINYPCAERMLAIEVLSDGSRPALLPTRPKDSIEACDFVKRLSTETQRIISEFKRL